MRVFFIGNLFQNNGPSSVNRNLYQHLKDKITFENKKGFHRRILTTIYHVFKCDIVSVSGLGFLNLGALFLATLLGKKTTYIMHGAISIEKKYTTSPFYFTLMEYFTLLFSSKIICVSNNFKKTIQSEVNYRSYSFKMHSINNGIPVFHHNHGTASKPAVDNLITIMSFGGGRPEKNNLDVCHAIANLTDYNIRYIVVGKQGCDYSKIVQFNFVEFKDIVEYSKVTDLLQSTDIYIQFSYYEPFGLAPLEALSNGCSLVLSRCIGMLSLIDEHIPNLHVTEGNIQELANAIRDVIIAPNNIRVMQSIDLYNNRWEKVAERYYQTWSNLLKDTE